MFAPPARHCNDPPSWSSHAARCTNTTPVRCPLCHYRSVPLYPVVSTPQVEALWEDSFTGHTKCKARWLLRASEVSRDVANDEVVLTPVSNDIDAAAILGLAPMTIAPAAEPKSDVIETNSRRVLRGKSGVRAASRGRGRRSAALKLTRGFDPFTSEFSDLADNHPALSQLRKRARLDTMNGEASGKGAAGKAGGGRGRPPNLARGVTRARSGSRGGSPGKSPGRGRVGAERTGLLGASLGGVSGRGRRILLGGGGSSSSSGNGSSSSSSGIVSGGSSSSSNNDSSSSSSSNSGFTSGDSEDSEDDNVGVEAAVQAAGEEEEGQRAGSGVKDGERRLSSRRTRSVYRKPVTRQQQQQLRQSQSAAPALQRAQQQQQQQQRRPRRLAMPPDDNASSTVHDDHLNINRNINRNISRNINVSDDINDDVNDDIESNGIRRSGRATKSASSDGKRKSMPRGGPLVRAAARGTGVSKAGEEDDKMSYPHRAADVGKAHQADVPGLLSEAECAADRNEGETGQIGGTLVSLMRFTRAGADP